MTQAYSSARSDMLITASTRTADNLITVQTNHFLTIDLQTESISNHCNKTTLGFSNYMLFFPLFKFYYLWCDLTLLTHWQCSSDKYLSCSHSASFILTGDLSWISIQYICSDRQRRKAGILYCSN